MSPAVALVPIAAAGDDGNSIPWGTWAIVVVLATIGIGSLRWILIYLENRAKDLVTDADAVVPEGDDGFTYRSRPPSGRGSPAASSPPPSRSPTTPPPPHNSPEDESPEA